MSPRTAELMAGFGYPAQSQAYRNSNGRLRSCLRRRHAYSAGHCSSLPGLVHLASHPCARRRAPAAAGGRPFQGLALPPCQSAAALCPALPGRVCQAASDQLPALAGRFPTFPGLAPALASSCQDPGKPAAEGPFDVTNGYIKGRPGRARRCILRPCQNEGKTRFSIQCRSVIMSVLIS
jgi:hypothetical protein